jgi:DNA gyrase subunit A
MDIGKIKETEITQEMEKSYLDYAMSVIVARALPEVRDGLKPVHRRILYAMHQMGLSHQAAFSKSAKVVGEVLGKYHPHGDMPVYDALVRMAQDFSLRYPLINGHGNFGSVDGDAPAAMRYTEVKMAKISQEMLVDIQKETVPVVDNFDATLTEPVYLPAKLPNLLLMGADGIAVGVATKIPPHNLGELVEAITYMIEKGSIQAPSTEKEEEDFGLRRIEFDTNTTPTSPANPTAPTTSTPLFESQAQIEDLLKFIKGPDFPTGGQIFDAEAIHDVYATGRGKIMVRGKAEIEEGRKSGFQIIISEIPYQVNKADLVAKIAFLAKDKKIEGIGNLRDESDRQGIRVVVELKRNAKPKSVLNNLYKHTNLQTSYPANIVALVDGTPQTLNLKQILTLYIRHRHEVITKKSQFELAQAKARAHILEGLKIALDNLDAVIATIKRSKDADQAKERLMKKFGLTEIQAQAILDMQLRRLAALERQKIEDEYKMVGETITHLTDLLAHPKKILNVIKKELKGLKEKYADTRRTRVFPQKIGEFSEADLVAKEETIITITAGGYLKRLPKGTFRTQRRGGKGVSGMATKTEDEIAQIFIANTHDNILFFTDKGKVFQLKVWEIPEASRQSKGQAIINLINIEPGEQIQSTVILRHDKTKEEKHLILATKKGTVKKTRIKDYAHIRSSGIIAIKLTKGDELCWARVSSGQDQVLLVTHLGKSIRFYEKDIRPTARDTMGVRGIKLKPKDFLVGMEVFPAKVTKPKDKRRKFFRDILVIMEKGIGKRSAIKEFPIQKRGGIGVKVAEVTPKTGKVMAARMVNQKIDQIIITSKFAQVIKLPLKNIPRLGRPTQGVILMRFGKPGDSVAAITCLEK